MRRLSRIALPVLGAGVLTLGTATAALATTIVDDSTGLGYNGDVAVTNINNTVITGLGPGIGSISVTCTSAALTAGVVANGSSGSLKAVSLTGCTNNYGGSTTISVSNLPYTGGSVTHDPVAGGRDGYLTIDAPNAGVDVRAVLNLTSIGKTEICHYGLTTTTDLVIDLYNKTNANRPATGNSHSQGALTGEKLQKISNPENTPGCPSTVTANGKYQVLTSPGGNDLTLAP